MTRITALLCALLAIAGCAAPEGPANKLEKASVLPLALDEAFQFRKIQQTTVDNTKVMPVTVSEATSFERARAYWGAIDGLENSARNGNYYNFFWRSKNPADVTVRLEYRQADLANYVMAQERYYPGTQGLRKTSFEVTGDDYYESGRVTAWRVLLIVDGRIVGFRQSFLWR